MYDVSDLGAIRFEAYVGVDRELTGVDRDHANVDFQVMIDGEVVFEKTAMQHDTPMAKVSVDIPEGAKTITLAVGAGSETWGDHADWADARFVGVEMPEVPQVTGLAVTGEGVKDGKLDMTVGQSVGLDVTVTPEDAVDQSVTWTVAGDAVSVGENGTVKALKAGTATVTVASVAVPSVTASVTVTVTEKADPDPDPKPDPDPDPDPTPKPDPDPDPNPNPGPGGEPGTTTPGDGQKPNTDKDADKNDGKDYLVALNGYPLSGQAVEPTGERYPVDGDGIRLLAPVIPSKVYGLAKNYEAHAQFMHEAGHSDIKHAPEDMVIFTKPSTSVIGPDDPIVIPLCSNDMNFEPELAVVMGRIAKNVPVEQAMDYVLGFTCVNDVTLRDLQGLDPTWTRAKGFDTACPLGPWIVTRDDVDWKDAKISFTLNGEDVPMASGTTANLIHGIPEQIAAITSFTTLLPGDVIMTGTPNASGHLDPGDEAIVHVEGIGDLRNVVVRG